jgi:hypothetical protein
MYERWGVCKLLLNFKGRGSRSHAAGIKHHAAGNTQQAGESRNKKSREQAAGSMRQKQEAGSDEQAAQHP